MKFIYYVSMMVLLPVSRHMLIKITSCLICYLQIDSAFNKFILFSENKSNLYCVCIIQL